MAPTAPTPPSDDALAAQMAARDVSSRQDAAVLGPARSEAAARALGVELPEGRLPAVPLAAAMPLPTPVAPIAPVAAPAPEPDTGPAPALTTATPAPPAPAAPVEPATRPLPPGVVLPAGGPAPVVTGVLAQARTGRSKPDRDDAVLELRPTVLATDVDRIGDQLVVLKDRLELRDRHGGLRRALAIADVVDVQVQRRLTSAVLVVSTRTATDMVVKGLRPETAETAQLAILDLRPTPAAAVATVDEPALLRAVMELHRAGVLDDREVADKTALIGRLAGRTAGA